LADCACVNRVWMQFHWRQLRILIMLLV